MFDPPFESEEEYLLDVLFSIHMYVSATPVAL